MKKKNKRKYPEPKRIKIGRNKFVADVDQKTPLVGLSWDAGNGQYYYTFFKSEKDVQAKKKTRKDYSFGVDYNDATFEYKQWIKDNRTITLSTPTPDTSVEQVINKPLSAKDREWYKAFYKDIHRCR